MSLDTRKSLEDFDTQFECVHVLYQPLYGQRPPLLPFTRHDHQPLRNLSSVETVETTVVVSETSKLRRLSEGEISVGSRSQLHHLNVKRQRPRRYGNNTIGRNPSPDAKRISAYTTGHATANALPTQFSRRQTQRFCNSHPEDGGFPSDVDKTTLCMILGTYVFVS